MKKYKEWIITNGIGGFASSTDFGGMNTRRYHGLLVAAMQPPEQRTMILSKLDESVVINGVKYNLYTNQVKSKFSEGHEYLKTFEKDIIPVYTFKADDVIVEKSIVMLYGKNAVAVNYKVYNQKAKTKVYLTPVVNFRDFHAETHSMNLKYDQEVYGDKVQLDFGRGHIINMGIAGSEYEKHENDMFFGMQYAREKERGFDYEENHAVPGTFVVEVKPNEDKEFTFVCSVDGKFGVSIDEITNIKGKDVIEQEYKRIQNLIEESELLDDGKILFGEDKKDYEELVKKYIIASDNFVAFRDSNNLRTIIAGYPWFLDWGRDAFIAFEGLLLVSKRFDVAKEVLLTFASKMKKGLLPNGFSEYAEKPLYNSVDSSLLFIEAVNKYLEYTKNYNFVDKKLYKIMKEIVDNYIDGIDLDGNNIKMDEKDFLISSGTPKIQNTWMDAKVKNKVITPRNGKVVEVNALWYNALKTMEEISKQVGKRITALQYAHMAKKVKKSFAEKFYKEDKKCLYDGLGDSKVRPNQLFAIGLTYPVIDCDKNMAKEIFLTCTQKLLNKYGMMTLAEDEPGFSAVYKGNPEERDSVYHQGPTWPWLIGPYYSSLKNLIKYEKNDIQRGSLESTLVKLRVNIANTFLEELMNGNTIGSICELYDSKDAEYGKGAFAQAWSVSEVFKILLEK